MPRHSVKCWPGNECLREKLVRSGAEASSDRGLPAILLRIGDVGQSTQDLGHELPTRYGNLSA